MPSSAPKQFDLECLAHELRTSLGTIRAAADMMVNDDYGRLEPKAHEVMKGIRASATRLLDLFELTLRADRLETESLPPMNLVQACAILAEEFRPIAEAKGIAFRSDFDSVPRFVRGDRELLRTMVSQLLDNAIKYTKEGEIIFEVRSDDDGDLNVIVCDTGRGIAPENLARVFERGYRADISADRHPGSGLGLYLCRQLAERLGGSLTVTSSGLDRGSRFTLRLPMFEALDSEISGD